MTEFNRNPRRRSRFFFILAFLFLSLTLSLFPAGQARAEESELDRMMSLTLHRSVLTKGVDMATLESILHRGEIVIADRFTDSSLVYQGCGRNLGVDTVVLTGVGLDVCVSSTARDAVYRMLKTIIVSDGTGSFSKQEHEGTLAGLSQPFGDIKTTKEVIELLNKR